MIKKKLTPAVAGKGLITVASYYPVVENPAENKNEGTLSEKDKKTFFSEVNNDNNDNDNGNGSYGTITTTI